jgi:hypothetical protein
MSHFALNNFIILMKKPYPFLKASPSLARQARAGNLRTSFDACFDKENPAGTRFQKEVHLQGKLFSSPRHNSGRLGFRHLAKTRAPGISSLAATPRTR